jgi:regulator-associated protein of mTOR
MSPQKALECIGTELQKQYERWQPRARYKHCLDPTLDEVKKLCMQLRKSAKVGYLRLNFQTTAKSNYFKNRKDDRVLFHYNGHGVPKPTTNGEIWVFNKVWFIFNKKNN